MGEYYPGCDYYEDNNGMYMYPVSKEKVLGKAKELFGEDITITDYDKDITEIFYLNYKCNKKGIL